MYFHLLPAVEDVGSPIDDVRWSAVLRSGSAFEMYRQRHGPIAPERVAEFMILDGEFPRSMNSCVINADQSLHSISGTPVGMAHTNVEEKIYRLRSELGQAKIDEIIIAGLHEFLENFQADINLVGQSIFDTYFALPMFEETASGNAHTETQ
jgi:uncharacterized alpha-E superfamily protein